MERLAADGRTAREWRWGGGIHTIFYGRGSQDVELRREIVGEALDDERVATEGEVWSMLLRRSDRYDESTVPLEVSTHGSGSEMLE